MTNIKAFLTSNGYFEKEKDAQLDILSSCLFNRSDKSTPSNAVLEVVRFIINNGGTWLIELFSKPLPASVSLP